ncbi:MAG: hypothetical protein ACP5I8_00955, partial [Phycisphaerae bacterium]
MVIPATDQSANACVWTLRHGGLSGTALPHGELAHGERYGRRKTVQSMLSVGQRYHRSALAAFFILLGMTLAGVGCAARQVTPKNSSENGRIHAVCKAPVWAVQLNWTPNGNSTLQVQYNSKIRTLAGTSKPTNAIFVDGKTNTWHTYTWKLTDVDFGGRENAGADLRLSGSPGIAVHKVVLSRQPPVPSGYGHGKAGGSTAGITFDTGKVGMTTTNTNHNLKQVAMGGRVIDSRYTCGVIAGRSAEILARHINVSYIYLRLSRNSRLFQAHPTVVYATVTSAATISAKPWSERTFHQLSQQGINCAELNIPWEGVERHPGHFHFGLLDQTLANAANAHIHIIPIFMYSIWPGNPASWITQYDVGSSGAKSQVPTWWSHFNRQSYFQYITATLAHIKNNPAFGGAFLDFGWLDYMWGPPPGGQGVNGYAP